jgi:RNA polymerase sigma factor (TIGR02999 family)
MWASSPDPKGSWSSDDCSGQQTALSRFAGIVRNRLCQLATWRFSKKPAEHSLPAAAIVNEACRQLTYSEPIGLYSHTRLKNLSARFMRSVLVDPSRSRRNRNRPICMTDDSADFDRERRLRTMQGVDVRVLDAALHDLEIFDPQAARVIELNLFGGLSAQQTAEVLHISSRTVKRDGAAAKDWLLREMHRTEGKNSDLKFDYRQLASRKV